MEIKIQIHPQLCKTYGPKSKITWPWYVEPKLDGLRGIVVYGDKEGTAFSRNGKSLWNINHILAELGELPWKHYVLDGEFFTEDWNLSMSILKTQGVHPEAAKIKYHVWDVIPIQAWMKGRYNKPLRDRKKVLSTGFANLETINVVQHVEVNDAQAADEAYRLMLEQGYEGGILKDPEADYILGTRSPAWLKMKPWSDADLAIVYAGEGQGRLKGSLGYLGLYGTVETENGPVTVTTEVGTGFTDAERQFYWSLHESQQLVGKLAEIKYQEITEDGSCRFPVFHRLREDK